MQCCGRFQAKEVQYLTPTSDFIERILLVGICPHCNMFVTELRQRRIDGSWNISVLKRKKALRLYEQLKNQFVRQKNNFKTGTKSNSGFVYGVNVQIKKSGKEYIRRYSVDFNGVKKLIQEELNG